MNKKIIYTVLGAIFAFGLLFLLWSLFFNGGNAGQTFGQFGFAGNSGQNPGTGGTDTNGQQNIGQYASNGTVTVGNNGTGQNTGSGNGSLGGGTTGGGGSNGIGGVVTGVNGSTLTMTSSAGSSNGGTGSGTTGGGTSGLGGTNTPSTYTVNASSLLAQMGVGSGGLGSIGVGDTVVIQGAVSGATITASAIIDQTSGSTLGTVGTGSTGGGTLGAGGTSGGGTISGTTGSGTTGGGTVGTGGTSGGTTGSGTTGGGTLGTGGTSGGTLGTGGNLGTGSTGINADGTVFTLSSPTVQGVDWLNGTLGNNIGNSSGTGGGVTSNGGGDFNPSAINQVADSNPSGTGPTIISANGKTGSDLEAALIAMGIGTAACTAGLLGGITGGAAASGAGLAVAAGTKVVSVPVSDSGGQAILTAQLGWGNTLKGSDTFKTTFLDCITRAIARAALQQITSSVVNWINSGFNGSPSFVTNPKQFFTNIADQAAGEYIQGSALSFLCSPFALQIKIAVAKSYANKGAQSCTLSKVIKNVNSFMSGNFSQGGWPGLLSITTMPTNNPYGAYAYAQIGVANAVASAQATKQNQLNQGNGFLTFQQPINCQPGQTPDGSKGPTACQYKDVTPGAIIFGTADKQLEQGSLQLQAAKSFDEIVSAFMTQLITKVLYNGLANTSGDNSYLTPDQQLAQTQAQALLTTMQASVQLAQQYGTTLQGSIADLQNAQTNINAVAGCWSGYASTTLADNKKAQALTNGAADTAQVAQLQMQVDSYNNLISTANDSIGKLQQLESSALSVNSTADVANISAQYTAAQNSGTLVSSSDLTNAQQNRTTLQSRLNVTNQAATAEMAQCQAFGQVAPATQ